MRPLSDGNGNRDRHGHSATRITATPPPRRVAAKGSSLAPLRIRHILGYRSGAATDQVEDKCLARCEANNDRKRRSSKLAGAPSVDRGQSDQSLSILRRGQRMESSSTRHNAIAKLTVFGIIPCILGVGIGQYLRWSGTIWLTDAGGFWPIACLVASLATFIKLATTSDRDRTLYVAAWLMIVWTWLYFPFWLTATEVPQSSAVVNKDGRVFVASEAARHPDNKVFLLTGRAGNRLVRNVAGTVTVNSVEAKFRFSEAHIARRSDEEDASKDLIGALTAALAAESRKSRSSRIALFETREALNRLVDGICRAVVRDGIACPLKLTLTPQVAATSLGGVWSKHYTEQEAINEKHQPALVQLLTQDSSRLGARDVVFALFMDLADTTAELAKVARRSRMLNEGQFDELIRRILIAPDGGDEALSIIVEVNRLNQEQRQALRAKVFREASIALIVKHSVALRIFDAEIQQLAARMHSAFEQNPGVAVSVLEVFGERLPRETQDDAVRAIVSARASYALAALRHVNFSSPLRETLLQKVITDADVDDLGAAKLSRETLEDVLTPAEMRPLVASVVKKCGPSKDWLDFAVRVLPIRALTTPERKTIVNELMFTSTKAALEFVSENRQYLEAADVSEITHDYTKTIARDMCLHLTHRNTNRGFEYFSEAQLQIFRECAQGK
jgi:hypothetical protein